MKINILLILLMAVLFVLISSPVSISKPSYTRIVGGQKSLEGVWPWMAAMVYKNAINDYYGHFCGATLIHPDWVLTAAHCIKDEEIDDFYIILGRSNLDSMEGEQIEVDQIIIHPDFNDYTSDFDLALLHLRHSSQQQYIRIIPQDDPLGLTAPDTQATIIGWGDTLKPFMSYPEDLQEVVLPIIPNQMAAQAYYPDEITDNMLAAGYAAGGRDSCTGDSGGPLMVQDGAEWVQAGIVSFGNGCARPGFYGIYTRISKVTNWIYQRTGIPAFNNPEEPIESGGGRGGCFINILRIK